MTQKQFVKRVLKPALFIACLVPFVLIVSDLFLGRLGANPVEEMTHRLGDWTLILLLGTLSVTPLRRLTGFGAIIQLRRMIGLFAFFYAVCHFSIFLVFDHFFSLSGIIEDVAKRPYITVGFTSLLLLVPLAITSTKGWVRRLGGKVWNRLHRLVYVAAAGGVLHYLWLVKVDTRTPVLFGLVLVALLATRLEPGRFRTAWRRARKNGSPAPHHPAQRQQLGSSPQRHPATRQG
jgi:sulfoxide reductase heme-binding subunit YedZ